MENPLYRIRDITLFPGIEDGVALPVVKDAEVHVRDGRFTYAGVKDGAPRLSGACEIQGRGMVLLPAFINAHAHSAMTLLRGAGAGLPLDRWLYEVIFPMEKRLTAEWAKAGIELAILEYLACGVTCVNDMYLFPELTARAMGESGMSALITNACVDFGNGSEQLRDALRFYHDFHGSFDGRVRAGVSVHAEYTSTPRLVEQVVDKTAGLDNVAHVHVSETKKEVADCIKRHGVSPVRYFHDLGLFQMPAIAAHCVAVSDEDLSILSRNRVTVALNPVSNLKLGSGTAPVDRMKKAGIRLAIGTDGAASNGNLDLFEEMKCTALLCKKNRFQITPAEVLMAAAADGARAMGFNLLGVIREGWKADCVLLDISAPNICPVEDIPGAAVYAARGDNVRMTMASGRVLYRDGEYLTMDRERVLYEAKNAARKLKA